MASPSAEDVREALECLYDPSALADCALARLLVPAAHWPTPLARAQQLRRLLLDTIASLQPSTGYVFGSVRNRSYDLLNLRHVEGTAIADIAQEIGITERQVYRDMQRAREELARLLTVVDPLADGSPPRDPLAGELAALSTSPSGLDLERLVLSAMATTQALAESLGRQLTLDAAPDLPRISADHGLLRQALTQLLSLALQQPGDEALCVRLESAGEERLCLSVPLGRGPVPEALAPLTRLLAAQGVEWEARTGPSGPELTMHFRAAALQKLLVVEDNPGAIQLYRRFLAQSPEWLVVGVQDARVTLDVVRSAQPRVVVLDIMMPKMDGWSVLQALRSQPDTVRLPVIVCSIFDDTPLARSLGASACLKKPVSQPEFLSCLGRCLLERE